MRAAGLLAAALAALAGAVGAQAAPDLRIVDVDVSSDTVGFGDRFEVVVRLRVPRGAALSAPASVPSTGSVEGVGALGWSVAESGDERAELTLRYPVIAYRVGPVEIPDLPLGVAPGPPDASGPAIVIPYDPAGPPPPGATQSRVASGASVWVASLLRIEDVAEGLQPRPADDVVGPSWNVPALLSGFAFGCLLLGIAFVSGRDWLGHRRPRPTTDPVGTGDRIAAARAAALAELDRLLERGLGEPPDAAAFYLSSSGAVRRYVEELDASWSPAFTSTELMRGLEARRERGALAALLREMLVAEVVKFGRLRPDPASALEHCRTLRDWVAAS